MKRIPSSDIVSEQKRSAMMRAVKRRDTEPELRVREELRSLGVRYRVNRAGLPGSPDLSNVARGWAIFVHGCFWHGHRNCKKTKGGKGPRIPKARAAFWRSKFDANARRDLRKVRLLRKVGLRVFTIWECELRNVDSLRPRLRRFLRS